MLFTDETPHIFTYTACVHLLRSESPEMEVCEVTKGPPQHGRRKQRLCREGRCLWAGGSAASIHFVFFSSAGNERWIHKTPIRAEEKWRQPSESDGDREVCQAAQWRPRYQPGSSPGSFLPLYSSWNQVRNQQAATKCCHC